MVIKVFIATQSGSTAIKKKQQDVMGFLEANKIDFKEMDIAANEDNRMWMRENVPGEKRPQKGNPLPPQIFNDAQYCGDFEAFFNAKEDNGVYGFLHLTPPPGSKEANQAEILQNGETPGDHTPNAGPEQRSCVPEDAQLEENIEMLHNHIEQSTDVNENIAENEGQTLVNGKDSDPTGEAEETGEEALKTEEEGEQPVTEGDQEVADPVTEEEEDEVPVTEDEEEAQESDDES
ncbi:SH3 domain-binding glutamic acid-rich protein isoform X2 [Callorhinchus milii]|uniref:SH3 domain-binding glutamic acid-rich protein isoform X2 n=1 Tax=Callorhinchus milii TaxID=7868 RepID=UPI001C3FF255|nr:SH3 domain-binding glutamic acid-rich protein isoform X2 [Callorhinchus milii]